MEAKRLYVVKNNKAFWYELLQMYRVRAGLTQSQLARLLGFKSLRMVQLWESGTNLPKAENLKRLIEILLEKDIFVASKERTEIEQLWTAIKDSFETRLSTNYKVYPILDEDWLDSLLEPRTIKPAESPKTAATTPKAPGNLTPLPNKFYGREREKEQLMARLTGSQVRLLTLSGPGGVGKTRLSQEVANRLRETAQASYPDGVWLVELTPLTDPQQVVQAVISGLIPGRRQEGDLYELLQTYLQPKKDTISILVYW